MLEISVGRANLIAFISVRFFLSENHLKFIISGFPIVNLKMCETAYLFKPMRGLQVRLTFQPRESLEWFIWMIYPNDYSKNPNIRIFDF